MWILLLEEGAVSLEVEKVEMLGLGRSVIEIGRRGDDGAIIVIAGACDSA